MKNISCAIAFHDANYAEVMRVQALIIDAAKRFLDGPAKEVMPEFVRSESEVAIRRINIADLAVAIRRDAAPYVAAKISAQYWAMVDACNFFVDATTSRWTYTTTEGRHQYLAWAAEEAGLV